MRVGLLHLAFLPGRDPSHALCVKVGGDRPSFDPPQCVNVGGDRPAWRPPSNLTVTAVSELKIGKIFFGRPNDERATARAPSLMSLEPAMRKLPADPQRGRVRHYAGWGRLESGKTGPPTASVGFASLAGSLAERSRTHGPQRIRRLWWPVPQSRYIRLFDSYTGCAKCGCDRPTSDPPECVKRAGDRSTDRSQCVTRVATR